MTHYLFEPAEALRKAKASSIHEPAAIPEVVIDAIIARVLTAVSFTSSDIRDLYRTHNPNRTFTLDLEGEPYTFDAGERGPTVTNFSRIMRALRETNLIREIVGPKGRVLWGLNPYETSTATTETRVAEVRAWLGPKRPLQTAPSTARELATRQYETIGPPDINLNVPSGRHVQDFQGFRGLNEASNAVPSALDALPPFKRVVETLKVIVGETVAKVVFDARGVQHLGLDEIREASPDDKLRWANRHTPGVVIPRANQRWDHRPNVPSIVLQIPV